MNPTRTWPSPGEVLLREVLTELTALSGPTRTWLPVSTVARAARRSITATYRALDEAETRGLAEARLHGHPNRPQREYRLAEPSGRPT